VIVADSSKQVSTLGKFPLPVEVIPFAQAVIAGKSRPSPTQLHCAKLPMEVRLPPTKGITSWIVISGEFQILPH